MTLNWKLINLSLLCLILVLVGTAWITREPPKSAYDRFRECMRKGEVYHKRIGSWPLFSDGRQADVVANARCTATDRAFDGLD
jgi:hypothetical protein